MNSEREIELVERLVCALERIAVELEILNAPKCDMMDEVFLDEDPFIDD